MQDYVLENRHAYLRALNLTELTPDPEDLEHGYILGKEMMPDAFPPDSEDPGLGPDAPAP